MRWATFWAIFFKTLSGYPGANIAVGAKTGLISARRALEQLQLQADGHNHTTAGP
jgi:hypothetical protein